MTEHFSYREAPLPQYSTDPYQDTFLPYADDNFLNQRLDSQNWWLRRYPQVAEHIQYALSRDDDESLIDTIEAASSALYLRNRFAELDHKTNNSLYSRVDTKMWTLSMELRKQAREIAATIQSGICYY